MIEVRGVDIEIGGRRLLDGLDFTIERSEIVAVLGPNGVGKTTLLRAVAAMHPVARGSVRVDGAEVARLPSAARARCIAFVTADDTLTDALSVHDVVAIGRYPHHEWWEWSATAADREAVARALHEVRMEDFADRLFGTLSSGERQRVFIALGLAQETPVLLLDEPTSHLDVRVAHEILALLRDLARAGKSVVCVLHDLNEAAAHADRILLLGCGTLLASGDAPAVFKPEILETAYGLPMEAVQTSGGIRVFPANAR
ncbi:MAG: ABC transporter ATP-binding protein [Vulcanimicrobiaceae bacterium]